MSFLVKYLKKLQFITIITSVLKLVWEHQSELRSYTTDIRATVLKTRTTGLTLKHDLR